MATQALYLNACGMVNSMGNSLQAISQNLFTATPDCLRPNQQLIRERTVYVGDVTGELPDIPQALAKYHCRNNQLILAALAQIQDQVAALINQYGKQRIAVLIGSSTSGILEGEQALYSLENTGKLPDAYHYIQQEPGTPSRFLQEYLGLEGINYTISTAYSSSAKVFASASRLIQSGLCDAAIIGGADSLCQLTLNGFAALESVAKERCVPMSANRDGISIGEGCALFILSRDEADICLLGTGESSDAHHMSAPDPTGAGAAASMTAALENAGLSPEQVDYINMHGTATPLNDAMESLAIEKVFGLNVACSSTKALTGHTLGAAGAIEAGLSWIVLSDLNERKLLPPHVWDGVVDEKLPAINLVSKQTNFKTNSGTAILSNSFAFGGNNASLILGKT